MRVLRQASSIAILTAVAVLGCGESTSTEGGMTAEQMKAGMIGGPSPEGGMTAEQMKAGIRGGSSPQGGMTAEQMKAGRR